MRCVRDARGKGGEEAFVVSCRCGRAANPEEKRRSVRGPVLSWGGPRLGLGCVVLGRALGGPERCRAAQDARQSERGKRQEAKRQRCSPGEEEEEKVQAPVTNDNPLFHRRQLFGAAIRTR